MNSWQFKNNCRDSKITIADVEINVVPANFTAVQKLTLSQD